MLHLFREHTKEADAWAPKESTGKKDDWEDEERVVWPDTISVKMIAREIRYSIQKQLRKYKIFYGKNLTGLINSKNIRSAKNYDSCRFAGSSLSLALFYYLIRNDTYKIMVGCWSGTFRSIIVNGTSTHVVDSLTRFSVCHCRDWRSGRGNTKVEKSFSTRRDGHSAGKRCTIG